MYTPRINKTKKKKPAVPKSQATFQRQLKKIHQLKEELTLFKEECEQALALYHSTLKPKHKEAGDVITQFILKVQDLIQKDPKALNKREKEACKELLEHSLDLVFQLLPYGEIHENLRDLYKDLHGKSYEDQFKSELAKLKKMFNEHPEMSDIDIDFSKINPEDDLQDVFAKFAESIHAAEVDTEVPPPSSKQKSKKQLLKEKHAHDLEELKNKGLSSIYKRLAKKLHPDLEQDDDKRIEKDHLMKRLSLAYKNQDLVSLLSLQSEYAEEFDEVSVSSDEETLKIYNALLKDQIEELKQEFIQISLHARYLDLHRHIENDLEAPLKGIKDSIEECKGMIAEFHLGIKDLSGKYPMKTLKERLASLAEQHKEEEFLDDFLDYMMVEEVIFSNSPRARKKRS